MARGTYFGHVTEHVALELSRLAGRDVHLGRTMWAGADGRYDVMIERPQDEPADSPTAAELLRIAIHAVQEILAKREPGLDAGLAGVSRLVEQDRCAASAA
jgi:cyanophycin synthetase